MTTRQYEKHGIYIFFQVHLKKKEESEVTEELRQNVKSEEKGDSEVKEVSEEKNDSEEKKDPSEVKKVSTKQNDSTEEKDSEEEKEDSTEQSKVSEEKKITIAKFYSFSEDKIDENYTMINMGNQDTIDGSNYTISIKSGIQENNKTILGAAYNGTDTFEIVQIPSISDIQYNIQKENSLLNFYHYGIYDWIIFKKIKDFIDDNEKEDLDPNQIGIELSNIELSNSDQQLRDIDNNLKTLESTVNDVEINGPQLMGN